MPSFRAPVVAPKQHISLPALDAGDLWQKFVLLLIHMWEHGYLGPFCTGAHFVQGL